MTEENITASQPKSYTPVAKTKSGDLTIYTKKDIDDKFTAVNILLFTVVIVLIIMVATLIIDSFHINSTIYKEYSQRNENMENIKNMNDGLIEQNIKNQEIIIEQQKQIQEILNK